MSSSTKNFQPNNMVSEKMPKRRLVISSLGAIHRRALQHIVPPNSFSLRGHTGPIVFFLLKVAALETIRRLSRTRCPFVWRVVQALPLLGCPPFKWIQRWAPFRMIVFGAQKLSRPLLLLSITTAVSDNSEIYKKSCNSVDDSQEHSESPSTPSTSDARNSSEESRQSINSENWVVKLLGELETQGITLPERLNEDELHRFYNASNGDFAMLLSSLKRTIRWRETYNILSLQELEMWSHLVFWHGLDVMLRPCLVIRLGRAYSSLVPHDRPRFAQALVSQIEYGVLHLVNEKDPRIMVLMDCEGLSPFKFPMQMLRSCATLFQDNYPDRLGTLFVIRLPPVVRVLAQTFIQVLKPTTRQKLCIQGENYQKVLSEILQSLPTFLGGNCTCSNCRMLLTGKRGERNQETFRIDHCDDVSDDEHELPHHAYPFTEPPLNGNCDHILRSAIVAMLMLWIFIAFASGLYDPESNS